MGVLNWDHYLGGGCNEKSIPQESLRSYGIPLRSIQDSKNWGLEPFSTSSYLLLVQGYPEGQYLPHTSGLLLHMDQADFYSIRGQPWSRKTHGQVWSGMLSAWPWDALELSSTAVSEIRDQGMLFEIPKMSDIISLMSYWRGILPLQGSYALKSPSFLWHLLHTVFNYRHSYNCISSLLG